MSVTVTSAASLALSVLIQARQPKSGTESRFCKRIRTKLNLATKGLEPNAEQITLDISDDDWATIRSLLLEIYEGKIQLGTKFSSSDGAFNAGLGELDEVAEEVVTEAKNRETASKNGKSEAKAEKVVKDLEA